MLKFVIHIDSYLNAQSHRPLGLVNTNDQGMTKNDSVKKMTKNVGV
jgi:hypothetical protein